jgi:hypothetical protein
MNPPRCGLLFGIVAATLAGPAQALSADSVCGQLNLAVCREARSSAVTSASVLWSDGTSSSLAAPDGSFRTFKNGNYTEGYKESLYADGGLAAQLDHAHYGGLGPALVVSYEMTAVAAAAPVSVYGYVNPGQASSSFLHGGSGNDPALAINSEASSDFGVNRAHVSMAGTVMAPYALDAANLLRPGLGGQVTPRTFGSAQSIWSDRLAPTAAGTASFDVVLDGTLTANSFVSYGLSAVDSLGGVHAILGTFISGSLQPGSSSRHLSGSLTIDPTLQYKLIGELYAFAQVPDGQSAVQGGPVAIDADFFNTARIDAITLSPGMTMSYGSGSANLIDVTKVAAVPEPQAWALMLAGGALLLGRRRR